MANQHKGLAADRGTAVEMEAKRATDPYSHSELAEFAELDTWMTDAALLLLAGIAPTGAEIDYLHRNEYGVHIKAPRLVRAQLLLEPDSFYKIPVEIGLSEEQALSTEQQAAIRVAREKLRAAEIKYQRISRLWSADPKNTFLAFAPPRMYLDWAERKHVEVPWRAWYETHKPEPKDAGRPAQSAPVAEPPLRTRERNNLLAIIGVLARHARIDLAHPSKAAMAIVQEAETLGIDLKVRTVEEHLKKVTGAMQKKMS